MTRSKDVSTLSWSKAPLSGLLRLAWPMMVSWLSFSTMTLVDTLFLGWDGSSSLAGVGLAGIIAWSIICFPLGLLQGTKTLASQSVGAGQEDQVGPYRGAALLWALGLGALALLVGQLAARGLPHLAATAPAGQAAREYLQIRILGLPLLFAFCALREVRQGTGDSRSPMLASVAANLLNIALDYVLIVRFQWGPAGAAMATVFANMLELGVLLVIQGQEGFAVHGLRVRHVRAVWTLGWPSGIQMLIEMGCFALLTVMISRYSELHMAAHQVAIQVIHFSFLPALSLGEAAAVLAGQAIGAGREDLVRRVARLALAAGTLYTGLCTLVLAVGGTTIASAFSDKAPLVTLAARLLLIAAIFQMFDAASMISRCVLRSVGDVRFPAVVGTTISWALTPPSMWLLGYGLGLGAVGGWLGLCAELILAAVVFWVRLERGGWKTAAGRAIRLRQEAAADPGAVQEKSGDPAHPEPG